MDTRTVVVLVVLALLLGWLAHRQGLKRTARDVAFLVAGFFVFQLLIEGLVWLIEAV